MDNFNHDKDEELIDLGAVSEETKGGGFTVAGVARHTVYDLKANYYAVLGLVSETGYIYLHLE